MCIVGKMAQDVGMVESIAVSSPSIVWLVFEDSIPTCSCFHSENFFVTCSCCFFYCFFRSSKREERQASTRGRCMACRV